MSAPSFSEETDVINIDDVTRRVRAAFKAPMQPSRKGMRCRNDRRCGVIESDGVLTLSVVSPMGEQYTKQLFPPVRRSEKGDPSDEDIRAAASDDCWLDGIKLPEGNDDMAVDIIGDGPVAGFYLVASLPSEPISDRFAA